MPRPTPAEELKPRNVRLTDRQWQRMQRLGGAEWLRKTINRSFNNGVSQEKAERNRRVRVDRAAGAKINDIAAKHGISWRTVIRICQE